MDLINLHKHMKEARVWGDSVSKDNSTLSAWCLDTVEHSCHKKHHYKESSHSSKMKKLLTKQQDGKK